jgi:hypothetical protein
MAAGPLNHVVLAAGSVADDLSYIALTDISHLVDTAADYRVIGGLMVTALAYRWNLGASLYRETLDVDLGIPPVVASDLDLPGRLKAAGYRQVAGDRFEKPARDIPSGLGGNAASAYCAAIDVLVPAYTSRPRHNVTVAPDLVTTEVPGLQIAIARPPVELALDLQRLNGDLSSVRLLFPDEVSALTLKALATTVRIRATDIVDIRRCLEICLAAGVDATAFRRGAAADGAAIIRKLFDGRQSFGIQTLAEQQRLSRDAADQQHTRIRALVARMLPT